jgi:hypothetical protein
VLLQRPFDHAEHRRERPMMWQSILKCAAFRFGLLAAYAVKNGVSALGQKRTHAAQQKITPSAIVGMPDGTSTPSARSIATRGW